ncbi:MAG: hypothetical protein FIB02_11530 [Desulfuromonas sp.]|nr:hypothetical protein [Desulfuromonas sp.]
MKRFEYVCLVLMLLAILAVGVAQIHDFDTFWQLQSGRYMVDTGSFIRTDLFTLAPDVPRFEHCWLHDLILYGLHALGGYTALSLWKGLMIAGTAAALVATALLRGASLPAVILTLPVFLLSSNTWTARPQLWTFLLFAIFVLLLERFRTVPSRAVLWLFPLAVFWTNLHAGSILALAILAAYLVGMGAEAGWRRQWRGSGMPLLLLAVGLVAGASLLSPYPADWLRTLLASPQLGASVNAAGQKSGAMTAGFIMDWTPTTFQNAPLLFYALAATIVIMLLGWRRFSLVDLCLLGGLALMGWKLVRHISFFYFGMAAILPSYLDAAVAPLKDRILPASRRVLVAAVLLAACAWGWLFYQPLWQVYGPFNAGLRTWHFPVAAAEFVKQEKLPQNIYNTYDWGGYLEWVLFPEYRVFWDQRQNSAEMFQLGWEAMAGKPSWQETFVRFGINTVVYRPLTIDTGQRYPLLDLLRVSPEWELVYADDTALIFVKAGSMSSDWLAKHRLPKERMDDTLLATARSMTNVDPGRYLAWHEMAQVHLRRREPKEAKAALEQYLSRVPQRDPAAERTWQMLENMTRGM